MSRDNKLNSSEESNNVYASNVKGETIHINQAISGRQGYYCLGCGREMQAMIAKIENRISFFRHDPEAVKNLGKCTYSDETYRHKLAKGILQDLKRIKVPALYKYPPKGVEGKANLIEEEKFIHASKVKLELSFFEDENGKIHYGKSTGINDKHLLIRPDVTFFDKDDNPILFIEVVATHKVTNEKRIKIKHLGIDTVQVSIPKETPEEIEKTLLTSTRTKWIYNYEQERREYLPISKGTTEEISPIDEQQRKLFEESFSCRQSEIRNLVRQFRKCLESEPYRDSEYRIRAEIQKVEGATKRAEEKLEELRNGAIRTAEEKNEPIRAEFKLRRKKFQYDRADLEKRYYSKKTELEDKEANLESGYYSKREILVVAREEFDNEEEEIEGRRAEISDDIESGFRESRDEFEYYFEREETEVGSIRTDIKRFQESSRQVRNHLRTRIQEELRKDADGYSIEKARIEEEQKQTGIKIEHTSKEIRANQKRQRETRTNIRAKYFEILRNIKRGKLNVSDFKFNSNIRKFKEAVNKRRVFQDLEKGIITERKCRSAIKAINNKAYVNWVD